MILFSNKDGVFFGGRPVCGIAAGTRNVTHGVNPQEPEKFQEECYIDKEQDLKGWHCQEEPQGCRSHEHRDCYSSCWSFTWGWWWKMKNNLHSFKQLFCKHTAEGCLIWGGVVMCLLGSLWMVQIERRNRSFSPVTTVSGEAHKADARTSSCATMRAVLLVMEA